MPYSPLPLAIRAGLLTQDINAYSDEGAVHKKNFHRDAKLFLRQLAGWLGLPSGSFDIRSNVGGIAVSGEITLHHEALYVQMSESTVKPGVSILFRSCQGRQDYTGGANQWMSVSELQTAKGQERFYQRCRTILERKEVVA